MKKLLLFSAYYEPEAASSLYLSTNLYEDFSKNGWEVELFVPVPTRGVELSTREYYKKNKIEKKGNLTIHRVWLPKEGKGILGRAIRYVLMNLAFIIKSIRIKADMIFVQSTPPTQGAMAAIIKKIKKIPFVYNLQDVFPDSMINMNMMKEGSFFCRIAKKMEKFTYTNSDHIIVISNDMKKNIINKGVNIKKVSVIPNWVDEEHIKPILKADNYLYKKFNINKDDFNVVYAGNLGYAQNIEVIIDAAEKLQNIKKIKFWIFGKGAQEDEYKTYASNLKVNNVKFLPIQPYSEVSYVYSLGDVCVVPCKKGFGGSAMPSKTWSIMATGTPILASFDKSTEMEQIVLESKVGLFNDSGDSESLAENIRILYCDENTNNLLGNNALEYVRKNNSRNICTGKYINIINNIERDKK